MGGHQTQTPGPGCRVHKKFSNYFVIKRTQRHTQAQGGSLVYRHTHVCRAIKRVGSLDISENPSGKEGNGKESVLSKRQLFLLIVSFHGMEVRYFGSCACIALGTPTHTLH